MFGSLAERVDLGTVRIFESLEFRTVVFDDPLQGFSGVLLECLDLSGVVIQELLDLSGVFSLHLLDEIRESFCESFDGYLVFLCESLDTRDNTR